MKLSKIFIFETAKNIEQRLKISFDAAQQFQTKYQNLGFTIAKIVKLYFLQDDANQHQIDKETVNNEELVNGIIEYSLTSIEQLKKYPKLQSLINSDSIKTFDDIVDTVRKFNQSNVKFEKPNKEDIFIQLPNKWYWLNLRKDACDKEATAMQHCGTDRRGILYSLRDKENKPHVTISYNEFTNKVNQIRGKQNAVPNKKYWPACEEFFKKTKAKTPTSTSQEESEFFEFLSKHTDKTANSIYCRCPNGKYWKEIEKDGRKFELFDSSFVSEGKTVTLSRAKGKTILTFGGGLTSFFYELYPLLKERQAEMFGHDMADFPYYWQEIWPTDAASIDILDEEISNGMISDELPAYLALNKINKTDENKLLFLYRRIIR